MELQHRYVATASRKLWRSMRVAFFVARKGLTSKTKLIVEAYVKACHRYTNLIVLHKSSGRSTARALPAGHSFRLWKCDYECFSRSPLHAYSKRSCDNIKDDARIDEELDYEVSGPASGSLASEKYSPGCDVGEEDNSGAANEDERLTEEIDDRAEEFIRRFYEELRAQSHDYNKLSAFL